MIFHFYATCVAVLFLDFGSPIPVPQVSPFLTCPSNYYLQNGLCYRQNGATQPPCSTCQTAVPTVPTAPCTAPSCQYPVAQPYSSQQSTTPCQNAVTQLPCQTVVPTVPTAPCTTQTTPCQNAVTQPCSSQQSTTPCQNAVTQLPCQTTVPTAPCTTPTTPCQNAVTQPCSSQQSTTPCQNAVTQLPCQTVVPTVPTAPCLTPSTSCTYPVTQPCPSPQSTTPWPLTSTTSTTSSPPTTTTTTTTSTTSTTYTPPRPEPIIRCPTGTILINGYCHLVYCGSGIYRDGKCIITVCPDGTVWTGSKCEAPVPQEYPTLNITNVIITNVNRTNDNHQMNYTNNITIHITESPEVELITVPPTPTPAPTTTPTPYRQTTTTTTSPPTNCCIIVTPNACTWNGNRHICKNQRYRRCGSVCTSKYIYLTPPKVQVIPPPPPPTCMENNCGYDSTPFYPDCSTCDNMIDERCMTYCQRSTCQRRQCQPIEMRGYCDSYRGSIGCRKMDGCTQDWCDDYSDYQ